MIKKFSGCRLKKHCYIVYFLSNVLDNGQVLAGSIFCIFTLPSSLFCNFKCMFAVVTDFSCPSQAKHTFCGKFVKLKLLVTKISYPRKAMLHESYLSFYRYVYMSAKSENGKRRKNCLILYICVFNLYFILYCIL